MSQEHLNIFIRNTVLYSGYNIYISDLTDSDLHKLISLAKAVLESPSEEEVNKKKLICLLYELECLVVNPHIEWEEKYDICWVIAKKIREYKVIDWCDPDCGYEDDVRAYHRAAKYQIEEL